MGRCSKATWVAFLVSLIGVDTFTSKSSRATYRPTRARVLTVTGAVSRAGGSPQEHMLMIQNRAKSRQWNDVVKLYRELEVPKNSRQTDLRNYARASIFAIQACERLGYWRFSSEIHAAAQKLGCRLPYYSSAAVMRTCAQAGQWGPASVVVSEALTDLPAVGLININIALSACARAGLHGDAQEIYDRLAASQGLTPDSYTLTAMIHSWAKLGRYDTILDTLQSLTRDPVLTIGMFNAAINQAMKAGRASEALELAELADECGVVKDAATYGMLMNLHSKALDCDGKRAVELMAEALSKGLRLQPTPVNTVLCNLGQRGLAESALELLEMMLVAKVPTSSATYQAVMTACFRADHFEQLLEVYSQMRKAGLQPDAAAYAMALTAAERSAPPARVAELVRDAEATGAATEAVYEQAMSFLAARGQVKLVVELMRDLEAASRFDPSPEVCTALVTAHYKAGDVEGAQEALVGLEAAGRPVGVEAYCSAISACRTSGDWPRALGVYERLVGRRDVKPNAALFNSLLFVLGRPDPQPDVVSRVLADMKAAGVSWDTGTYASLMTFHSRLYQCPQVMDLWDELTAGCLPVSMACARLAVSACEVSGSGDRAEAAIETLYALGLSPSTPLVNTAIRASGAGDQPSVERALRLLKRMETEGPATSVDSYAAAISACEHDLTWPAPWRAALHLLVSMIQKKLKPPPEALHSAMRTCVRCEEWRNAYLLMQYMVKSGIPSDEIAHSRAVMTWATENGAELENGGIEGAGVV
mmetsp:Transcript_4586/g.10800  ORF Transcript_4586/g.10800 Transcript_4586/m.10800 type:complete len:763 (+) Transcript_4586:101-2389(+)|eukprot:CAMPEP_0172617188 /NCGR_PEP_ID=MMETSP1068-20121228/70088_1 /TAXON_ID=35684 /ORGANISM="Pseudopedinella elastica, Strain CCMP716" /LENGTH=762 /DNA_ID=CAMNT_0013422885 /DNA_START=94 /DNA_END=2382 /DNA_ORIENTATION=+